MMEEHRTVYLITCPICKGNCSQHKFNICTNCHGTGKVKVEK